MSQLHIGTGTLRHWDPRGKVPSEVVVAGILRGASFRFVEYERRGSPPETRKVGPRAVVVADRRILVGEAERSCWKCPRGAGHAVLAELAEAVGEAAWFARCRIGFDAARGPGRGDAPTAGRSVPAMFTSGYDVGKASLCLPSSGRRVEVDVAEARRRRARVHLGPVRLRPGLRVDVVAPKRLVHDRRRLGPQCPPARGPRRRVEVLAHHTAARTTGSTRSGTRGRRPPCSRSRVPARETRLGCRRRLALVLRRRGDRMAQASADWRGTAEHGPVAADGAGPNEEKRSARARAI